VGADGAYEIDISTGSTNHVLNMMGIEGATDAGAENLVYARTPLLDLLLLVNLDSWSFQALGSMAGGVRELAFDEARRELWATSSSSLIRVDPITGHTVTIGALYSTNPWVTLGELRGLDYDVARDRLVGTDSISLWAIDKTSGACAWIGAHNAPGLEDIHCDPASGIYWGVSSGRILLATEGLPPGQPALLIASQAWSFLPPVPGTMGYQCVIGNLAVFRDSVSFADNTGRVMHDVDLTAMPTRPTSTSVQPGETWHFQAWYRDNLGGSTTNFSLPTRIDFQ
jgi:hypothetical protein